jgi:DNA modification methylase
VDCVTYSLHHHDARNVSTLLEPESVDLIVTSPPYFALRSYRDGGEHYDGQLGSEPTPSEFVDALIACTADWLRVLRPGGSLWVNLGDSYAGTGKPYTGSAMTQDTGNGGAVIRMKDESGTNVHQRRQGAVPGIKAKSLMGLPWRYALRCIDELGLILRAEVIWSKPNGLPESVTDRVRRSHEQWFHFVRQGRYFAAIDEVREAYLDPIGGRSWRPPDGAILGRAENAHGGLRDFDGTNPLGKAPGSVWTIPSEPLVVPDDLGVDHFAAFPSEWPRRIILGWSPSGYCTACDEPRRAVVDTEYVDAGGAGEYERRRDEILALGHGATNAGPQAMRLGRANAERTITGYACACTPYTDHPGYYDPEPDPAMSDGQHRWNPPHREHHFDRWTPAPTTPSTVLDPFVGTGTVPAVAHLLGRHGIGTDLSRDYLRLAEWRCTSDTRLRDKVLGRSGIPNPKPPVIAGQLGLFGEIVA